MQPHSESTYRTIHSWRSETTAKPATSNSTSTGFRMCREVIIQTVTYTAIIEFDSESKMYIGSVPELPGAFTQAATLDELRANLYEVAELVIADMIAHGELPAAPKCIGTQMLTVKV